MAAEHSHEHLDGDGNMRSDPGEDADAHISKKQRVAGAEPNWQEQLQYASEGAFVEQLLHQQNLHRDESVNENIIRDDNIATYPQRLPQGPAGVETDRMQLQLRSATASPSIGFDRTPRLQESAHNQLGRALPTARGPMVPFTSLALAPSQKGSSHPTDTTSLAPPAVVQDEAGFNKSGRYDYNFQAFTKNYKPALNFTAVEIITFLPMLHCNSTIARRFVNNGLENPIHAEINDIHRVASQTVATIAKGYQDALRPSNWRQMTKKEIKTLWTRRNQTKPADWDEKNISMNAFVPDRIIKEGVRAPAPTSVPFRMLTQGVRKIPTGNDAADLTRSIEFATSDQAKKTFPGRDLMFPDDLIDILRTIGPTLITQQHRDKSIVMRYRKLYKAKKALRKGVQAEKDGRGESSGDRTRPGSRQDTDWSIPSESSSPLPKSPPQGTPRMSKTSHSSVSRSPHNASQLTQDFKADSTMTRTPLKSPREHQGQNQSTQLLRDLDVESLPSNDTTSEAFQLGSAIWYARRPDQKDIDWHHSPEHLAQISLKLQAEAYEEIWEQSQGDRQRAMDDSIATLQQQLGVYVPPPRFTAEDYEQLFSEPAPEYLEKAIKHNEPFEGSSGSSRMQIDSSRSD
ncbi:hypothetical protein P171DRAFT_480037 [Karstenula rhodostoma CBS 690.94]|uniref:Uncharacterized protein n=1 Tax=Karstenula rhodostoma CBS 690.94 TaxID=1392251 RepID=A0A9P4PY26_9PLEO|nr:hypothetical protein P171DRAFT_480037 [Karstenula rhodostoma CBS 690.94]